MLHKIWVFHGGEQENVEAAKLWQQGENELSWGQPGNKFFQEITYMEKLSQEEECEENGHCVHTVSVHVCCVQLLM